MGNKTFCCASRTEEQGGNAHSQSLHQVIEDTRKGTECNSGRNENESNAHKMNQKKRTKKLSTTTIKTTPSLKDKKKSIKRKRKCKAKKSSLHQTII
ncbi:unnamed protein product [Moneuplotes crassus]|uniref:Uncharacterized protein n=1 Tax=Euplotes crassus TaxID=5936 RepID=A0AAD1XPR2_EUPCR|nr:unnamed protein product [Moneuplotes crassus]